MATNIFKDYRWHSVMKPEQGISGKRKINSLQANPSNLSHFNKVASGEKLLIHKSTKALWKFSDDKKSIVPVFKDDVLTEDNF